MQTITVTGTIRPPQEVEKRLNRLTTIEEILKREGDVNRRRQILSEDIESLEDELHTLESEFEELEDEAKMWLPARFQQLIETDQVEADKWVLRQALNNPDQQKFDFRKVV